MKILFGSLELPKFLNIPVHTTKNEWKSRPFLICFINVNEQWNQTNCLAVAHWFRRKQCISRKSTIYRSVTNEYIAQAHGKTDGRRRFGSPFWYVFGLYFSVWAAAQCMWSHTITTQLLFQLLDLYLLENERELQRVYLSLKI